MGDVVSFPEPQWSGKAPLTLAEFEAQLRAKIAMGPHVHAVPAPFENVDSYVREMVAHHAKYRHLSQSVLPNACATPEKPVDG